MTWSLMSRVALLVFVNAMPAVGLAAYLHYLAWSRPRAPNSYLGYDLRQSAWGQEFFVSTFDLATELALLCILAVTIAVSIVVVHRLRQDASNAPEEGSRA